METDPVDGQSMPPEMHKNDARMIAVISLSYTALNLCMSLFLLRDVNPMSIYPASIAFITACYFLKKRLPSKKGIVIFLCIYEIAVVFGCIIMAMQNGLLAIDFSKLLEPAFFLPLVALIFFLASAMKHRQVIPRMYFACGLVFVAVAVVSIIPGNPVIVLLNQGAITLGNSAYFQLIDANAPASLAIGVYLWFHVPFVMLLFGGIALVISYTMLFTKKKIKNFFIILLIISIVFSIYVIGVAFTWMLLRCSCDASF